MNILSLIQLIIGVGETIVPIFVHNPKTQQLQAVLVSDAETIAAAFQQAKTAPVPPAPLTPGA